MSESTRTSNPLRYWVEQLIGRVPDMTWHTDSGGFASGSFVARRSSRARCAITSGEPLYTIEHNGTELPVEDDLAVQFFLAARDAFASQRLALDPPPAPIPERSTRVIELKCWPRQFAATRRGLKGFEVRKNDRDYKVGNVLVLCEYDPSKHAYTGRRESVEVTFVETGGVWGLSEGWVALGTRPAWGQLGDIDHVDDGPVYVRHRVGGVVAPGVVEDGVLYSVDCDSNELQGPEDITPDPNDYRFSRRWEPESGGES